jgi:hypothetical protein
MDIQPSAKINPAVGCTGREEKERRYAAKCIYRVVCFHLIYQEKQFCGCIPRERVNHVYLVVLVIENVLFVIRYIVIALLC